MAAAEVYARRDFKKVRPAVPVAVTASGTVDPTIVEPSLDECCVIGDAIVDGI